MRDILTAFLMTVLAGLSTGIGSVAAFVTRRTGPRFMGVTLGFSAGVMLYVSMIEIFGKAQEALVGPLGTVKGNTVTVLAFFGGILLIYAINRLIPSPEDAPQQDELQPQQADGAPLMRTGVFTALAIAVHNFPEGLATFVSALGGGGLAIPVVAAIAIHNIPEGIAVSVPIYRATGSRWRAFWYSLLSGLAEPVGAVLGWLLLRPVMSDTVFGILFAAVAGIMVFLSLDELLPVARSYHSRFCTYGMIAGMAVMAVSLLLFL